MAETHIINRLPSNLINDKTPFELLHKEKPDYDFMRVFGCLVCYRNTNNGGDKFKTRGRPKFLLGYPPGTKGYKIYDLEYKKIIVSRYTKFCEDIFPFKEVAPNPLH